jgi:DNA-binding response OmpR family regulator
MIESAQILLVDEDDLLQDFLQSVIYLHNPAYQLFKAHNFGEAAVLLEKTKFDLVITEVEFSEGTSFKEVTQFVLSLQKYRPVPMVMALTSGALLKDGVRLHVDDWLPKPPAADALLAKVDDLINATKESVLRGVSVNSVVQMLAHDTKSCTVIVFSGNQKGRLYLNNGELVHADVETSEVNPTEAAKSILSWSHCVVRLAPPSRTLRSINRSLTSLLIEAAMHRDVERERVLTEI